VIDRAAEAYTTDGYTLEQTRREVSAKVRRVAKKYETGQWVRPELKVVAGETDEIVDLGVTPVGLLQPMLRKKREFLVPGRFMRGHVTLTSAAPGVGKTTWGIQEAIALVSGQDFLGFQSEPMRVVLINNEETLDELERRIEATCQCFDVPLESVAENLFIRSGVDAEKFVIARDVGGQVVAAPRVADGIHDPAHILSPCGVPATRLGAGLRAKTPGLVCPLAHRQYRRWTPSPCQRMKERRHLCRRPIH
jgi:hypothetical protein